MFKDTIEGAPTSKPAILKRLENEQLDKTLFKDNTVVQIVSRLKHERKRKQSNKGLGDNKKKEEEKKRLPSSFISWN